MAITTADSVIFSAYHRPRKSVAISVVGDDYVQIDAWAAARVVTADTVGTFSAWVNVPDVSGTYSVICGGDASVVEYIHFSIEAGKLFAACNVATTMQWDINSTNVVITPHKWHHIALVQNATRPTMYVDGAAVAMTDTVTTDLPAWFSQTTQIDQGLIGAAELNGNATVTQDLIGAISDVKHWNSALSAAEVKLDMEGTAPATLGMTADASNLISWWDMDKDYVDSVSAHDGTASGAVYLDPEYSEVTSKLRHEWTAVVADEIYQSVDNNGFMYVTITKA